MKDLQDTRLMWLKGGLFLGIGVLSGGLLLIEHWSWRIALLLGLCIWGFCRAYFFAFYVIERWVDSGFKFSGLGHFFVYAVRRWRGGDRES
tara:strand:- start:689 stop:961 length:273 start_codon:yes stop_codon:yes gene_type:complete